MFQECARHRLQHVKQRDLHVASLTQQGAHRAQRPGGVLRVIDGAQHTRDESLFTKSRRRERVRQQQSPDF